MGESYPIPTEALDDRLAFVGTAGSGKTYSAGTAVERLLASSARCVIVDPLDVWWGLRLAPDGETPSRFRVVIFGGAHGDLPLNEHAGALLGETVAAMRESCIVSLGALGTKAAERRFMLAFLTALYRHVNGEPLHLVVDEADMFAPQQIRDKEGEAPKLLGQMETIVRRGRIKGFVPWLITQRPAVLNKDVLSQADGLIALKLTASQDRDAIGAWIEGMADRAQGREILGSLPAMQRGEGVVWIPGRGVLQTSTFPLKATYDSSRTPKRGEIVRSATLKPLDLGKLRERMASVEAEAKANDPRELRAEIVTLRRDLAKATDIRTLNAAAPDPAVIERARQDGYAGGFEEGERIGRAAGEIVGQSVMLARAQQALEAVRVDNARPEEREPPRKLAVPARLETVRSETADANPNASGGRAHRIAQSNGAGPSESATITGPQQRILDALAWWTAFGISDPTNEQVGFVAGYSPGSGNFNNLKGQLRAVGLLEYPTPGRVSLTDAGAAQARCTDVDLSQSAFHARVREKLTVPQLRLLDPVLGAYPDSLSSDAVAEAAGYSVGSGNFNNLRGQLRTIGLIDYPAPGQARAADWLFP